MIGVQSIIALTEGLTPDQARWKPTSQDWSILEVINHLYDEEREDFRLRVQQTIERPREPLPPIDPERWAIERHYNDRELVACLEAFVRERRASLTWLATLRFEDWDRRLNHPRLAELRVGDVLAAWAGHDLLHIRQLNELRWLYLNIQMAPYELRYAGDWYVLLP